MAEGLRDPLLQATVMYVHVIMMLLLDQNVHILPW